MVDLSIIVVNWNTRELLARCLRSVYDTMQGLEFEVWVVDNASTDGSAAMVKEMFPQALLLQNEENVGFARANNQAILKAAGRYLLLLNSDAELLPGAAHSLVAYADACPRAGIVGGRLINPDGSFQASYADFPTLLAELLNVIGLSKSVYGPYYPSYPPWDSTQPREVDWVGGACLLARRAAVQVVGLMDEDYALYTEEVDWCYRMRCLGWQVHFCPDATTLHHGGASTRALGDQKWKLLRQSSILFLRKHHGAWSAWFLSLVVSLALPARALKRSARARLRREVL